MDFRRVDFGDYSFNTPASPLEGLTQISPGQAMRLDGKMPTRDIRGVVVMTFDTEKNAKLAITKNIRNTAISVRRTTVEALTGSFRYSSTGQQDFCRVVVELRTMPPISPGHCYEIMVEGFQVPEEKRDPQPQLFY